MRLTKDQYAALMAKRPKSKYGNVRTEVDGEKFDSKREANRYLALKAQESAKAISGLRRQVKYPLTVKGELICTYKADFVYHNAHGDLVVEDSKGVRTPTYRIKAKLFRACYGMKILET